MNLTSTWQHFFGRVTIPWYEEHLKQQTLATTWGFEQELHRFTKAKMDACTLSDAVRGVQIFGAVGSGKTSGSGRAIALSYLRSGFGGLVLCVKVDEADLWEKYCREAGRLHDLVRIRIDGQYTYNFLDGEANQGAGALAQNVAELFSEVMGIIDRAGKGMGKDDFWAPNVRKMLNHAIVLDIAANGRVTVDGITRVVTRAPLSRDSIMGLPRKGLLDNEKKGEYWTMRELALKNAPDDIEVRDALDYFENEFAGLADKTRSIIVASFTAMADDLRRPALRKLLCGETNCRPEEAFAGKIIVVDLPVHELKRVGRIGNVIWKTVFKNACQRRRNPDRPVFLWVDESQYVVDDSDVQFLTTARGTRCCVVYLTQNISNYMVELGSRDRVDALLGSMHMKIYHQNGEQQTNEYATKSIGRMPTLKTSESKPKKGFFESKGGKTTVSTSTEWDYDVPSRLFTNLRSGGVTNGLVVDGVVHLPGKRWSSGKTWLMTEFNQKTTGCKQI